MSLLSRTTSLNFTLGQIKLHIHKILKRSEVQLKSGIQLSDEQLEMYEFLEQSNKNTFITGKAGTGKSVLLKHFVANTSKQIVVVAPTGIAAMNIKGQTIHSLFKLKPGLIDLQKIIISDETRQLLWQVDAIVIDEVSMVRADVIDGLDRILKAVKKRKIAFGGVQIIAFGDVYQLPPVVESVQLKQYFMDTRSGPYFFNANVWQDSDLQIRELQTVFRQSNKQFKAILDAIRNGAPSQSDFETLHKRVTRENELPKGDYLTLTSTNAAAKRVNDARLALLQTKTKVYEAKTSGSIRSSSFPTDAKLMLKIGAQVIFLKNDPAKRWVNGALGTVVSLSKGSVHVRYHGRVFEIFPDTWEKSSYFYDEKTKTLKQEIVGEFSQIPLRLAWAITIHKSQGCSYARVAVDLRDGAFAHGQTYVALSRCRTLTGLYLLGEIKLRDIIVERTVVEFMMTNQHT